ncbi:MAG: sulfite exporter TauE/SafE family protein [Kiritimatiellia bacterium]|nr:sulfite exporter TauE/SafE family protein [Kiritimatiellia bacterium]
MKRLLFSPWRQAVLLAAATLLSAIGLGWIALRTGASADGLLDLLSTREVAGFLAGFFLISLVIALVSVISGIGGGVLFTPIMLAFTPVDSLIIRATGLVMALCSGLVSTGTFMRKGIGNFRICALLAASQGAGSLLGALAAIRAYHRMGESGEAAIRMALGLLILFASLYLLKGGKKREWPEVRFVDRFTERMGLGRAYFEESEQRVVHYAVRRAGPGLGLVFLVGLVGGFFGLGAGWALTPVQNIVMGIPLKVATANSGIILGMGGSIAVWPYLYIGALLPLFVLPWIGGMIAGGYCGSLLLVRIRVGTIRLILIGILFFSSFGLISRGLEMRGLTRPMHPLGMLAVFLILCFLVFYQARRDSRKERHDPPR